MVRYKCPCSYVYQEDKGCPDFRNPPGTAFQDLPEEWTCPKCGYEKECFRKIEEEASVMKTGVKTGQGEEMAKHDVAVFRPYPFVVGQKIFIEEGKRRGDWEVIGVSDDTVRLKCPISFREFEWKRFCYLVEEQTGRQWPQKD